MDVDWWPVPVSHRRGSKWRLLGIDVFYDFEWSAHFPDNRVQFKNGLSLARLAHTECPPDKEPTLLLTTRVDVTADRLETSDRFFVVINFPRYLALATSDPAAAYYAHLAPTGVTDITRLQEAARDPTVVRTVFEQRLDAESIAAWAGENLERLEQLKSIVAGSTKEGPTASRDDVIRVLQGLEDLDAEYIRALEGLLGRAGDREAKLAFLRALTEDRVGRYATSQVLGDRLRDRIQDARQATARYRQLVADPTSNETDVQGFIEDHPGP